MLALVLVGLLAAGMIALAFDRDRRRERSLERRERAWEAERNELLNRIMYLSDKTWTIPPADIARADDFPVFEPDEVSYDPLYSLPEEMS